MNQLQISVWLFHGFVKLDSPLFSAFLIYAFTSRIIVWLNVHFSARYFLINNLLKLRRIRVEFQSRKAHSIQLKEKDILRILFFIMLCVLGYLTAWTMVDLEYANDGFSLITNTSLKGLIQYNVCKIKWWDYFMEIGNFNAFLYFFLQL